MKDTSLTQEELGALLGDDEGAVPTQEAPPKQDTQDTQDILRENIESSLPAIKSEFSQKLGEEVDIEFLGLAEYNNISAEGASQWYISKGSFSNNGFCQYVLVFPDDMAHGFAKQFSGVEDLENNIENIGGPLKELSVNIVNALASGFNAEFKNSSSIEDFELSTDLQQIEVEGSFFRAEFKINDSSFYQFFSVKILELLAGVGEASFEEDDIQESESHGGQISDILSASNPQGGMKNIGEDILASSGDSLGSALLKGNSSVTDVEFPAFTQKGVDESSASNQKIDMLMDVTVDVTVELGHATKTVSEVLELGRGTILDLNKLAGEPLDIKLNNKLIAKGEVVVIDENFGVRIVEIVSNTENVRKK